MPTFYTVVIINKFNDSEQKLIQKMEFLSNFFNGSMFWFKLVNATLSRD